MGCNKLPQPQGLLKKMMDNILDNSYIKQPSFALSASLALLATVVGRKLQFQGIAPNLYILNIASSGGGKDMPQKKVKEFLVDSGNSRMVGTGSYTSDAGLTDRFNLNKSILDIVDEAGEELIKLSTSKSEYGSKMAAILTELYTSSTSKFLGRALKDGNVGEVDRPNLNILASTTPTGFAQGVTRSSIEKGLLGRFFVFVGDHNKPAQRIHKHTHLDAQTIASLQFWGNYKPPETSEKLGNINQEYLNIESTEEAEVALDKVFEEFDNLRRSTLTDNILLPVIARLYQQTLKIALLHAVSRAESNIPTVDYDDVVFAYHLVKYAFDDYAKLLDTTFAENKQEKVLKEVLRIIENNKKMYHSDLVCATKGLQNNQRDGIIKTLEEGRLIFKQFDTHVQEPIYYIKEENE